MYVGHILPISAARGSTANSIRNHACLRRLIIAALGSLWREEARVSLGDDKITDHLESAPDKVRKNLAKGGYIHEHVRSFVCSASEISAAAAVLFFLSFFQ